MSKKVTLPSGAELDITLPPFAVSKALYQAMAEEGLTLKLNPNDEVDVNLFKNLLLMGLSSKKVEKALEECFKRVTYKGLRVDQDTWESVEARGDYLIACFEVAVENVSPFMKSLYARYAPMFQELKNSLMSKSQKTSS